MNTETNSIGATSKALIEERDAGRPHRVLEVVARALLHDTDHVEDDPREQRQQQRHTEARVGRELHTGDDLGDVAEEDEEEQRSEVRQVPEAVGADRLHDDLVADEADARLGRVLQEARGNERILAARAEPEHENRRDRREDVDPARSC